MYPDDQTQCFGVDLNRNFDISFGEDVEADESDEKVASSNNIYSYTYHGKAPFSEPETKALKSTIENIISNHGKDR